MNFRIALQFCCFFTLWASTGFAAGELEEFGGANDNPHNLSSLSSNLIKADTETQICIFCHTPHGAAPQSTLWSRMAPAGPFPINSSGTLVIVDNTDDSHYGIGEYPNGASKMCLSCHDGVTAIGTLLGDVIDVNGGPDSTMSSASTFYFEGGGDLSLVTSHPVSFTYDGTVATHITDIKGAGTYILPTDVGFLDSANRVQCTSCHEPHKDTRTGTYNLPFWRGSTGNESNDYDHTCQQCHSTTLPTSVHP